MRAPGLDDRVCGRIEVETPDLVEAVLSADQSSVFVTAHLGPIELPAVFVASRSGRRVTAPMETLGDPALQRWFERTRGVFGVHIVGLAAARRELLAALRRGEIVGIVADRDITGGGIEVPLFGAPAPLPAGPALLLTEVDVPVYAAGIWRTCRGRRACPRTHSLEYTTPSRRPGVDGRRSHRPPPPRSGPRPPPPHGRSPAGGARASRWCSAGSSPPPVPLPSRYSKCPTSYLHSLT